jgi:hypothetical protein
VAATTEKAGFIASGFMAVFVAVFVVAAFAGEADRGEGVGATLTGGARAIHILILIGVTAAVITGAVTAAVFTQAAMGERLFRRRLWGERLREIAESVGVSWLPVV